MTCEITTDALSLMPTAEQLQREVVRRAQAADRRAPEDAMIQQICAICGCAPCVCPWRRSAQRCSVVDSKEPSGASQAGPFVEFECLIDAIYNLEAVARANGIELRGLSIFKKRWAATTAMKNVAVMGPNGPIKVEILE